MQYLHDVLPRSFIVRSEHWAGTKCREARLSLITIRPVKTRTNRERKARATRAKSVQVGKPLEGVLLKHPMLVTNYSVCCLQTFFQNDPTRWFLVKYDANVRMWSEYLHAPFLVCPHFSLRKSVMKRVTYIVPILNHDHKACFCC